MKRGILALVMALALVALVVPAAVFAAEGTVTCTVSAVMVSVTVTDGDVHYGTVNVGATKSSIDVGETQTATNDGSASEDFNIKSSDATGTTQNWTLVTTTPGTNEFKHEFSKTSSFPGTALTTSYQSLATDIAKDGTQTFDLRITMPSSTTDYGAHTITVTVQAVQH